MLRITNETSGRHEQVPVRILDVASRGLLRLAAACLILVCCLPPAFASNSFSFDNLRERARGMAGQDYRPQAAPALPDFLKNMSYEQYRSISARDDVALWQNQGLHFVVQFFHRGFLYQDPVVVHIIEEGRVADARFSPVQFNYGTNKFPGAIPENLGYAGLQVYFRPGRGGRLEEVASFVGASYFRIIGAGQHYGAAARGLALDTGETAGEEFPRFTEFWVQRPKRSSDTLQLLALLDSPSSTGAYRFTLHPGVETALGVEASLFLRKEGKKIGLAPLTSMFLMGKNRTRFFPDFRPEVHDSDGLLIQTSDQWLWRPLENPAKVHRISRFPVDELSGFGLLQRERDFRNYQDLIGRYDLRPSFWVIPENSWGAGTVELVEIPTPSEYNDNIVAYWIPKQKPTVGQEYRWKYRLTSRVTESRESELLRVQATRIIPEHDNQPPKFVIDFNREGRIAVPPRVDASIHTSRGTIRGVLTQTNSAIGGWRTSFDLADVGGATAEVRLRLEIGRKGVSETWIYHYQNP